MMNCEQCKTAQVDCLLQELSAAEQKKIEPHIQQCGSCRREFQTMSALWHTLDEQVEAQPSPQLRKRFESMLSSVVEKNSETNSAVNKTTNKGKPERKSFFQFIWPTSPTWALSYSFLLLCGGMLMGQALPQSILLSQKNSNSILSQFDYSNIPEDRLVQLCSVQNSQYFETL